MVLLGWSPASEASREVANLTERKNTHPPLYGVKEFVCLSACYQFRPKLTNQKKRLLIYFTCESLTIFKDGKPAWTQVQILLGAYMMVTMTEKWEMEKKSFQTKIK